MSQEKYASLLELANANGTTYELSEGDGVLHITGTAPSDEAKAELWAEYERLDPDFQSSDLILNITTGSGDAGAVPTRTQSSQATACQRSPANTASNGKPSGTPTATSSTTRTRSIRARN